ncbi:MAG: leucyl aminopeptidase [Nocardioidaceae bacterium]|nr:leucyl aminopeptidase [Nocardioidaceae bacterium]
MTAVTLRKAPAHSIKADAIVIGVHADGDSLTPATGASDVVAAFGKDFTKNFTKRLRQLGATGKAGDVCKIPAADVTKAPMVVLAGLGEGGHNGHVDLESLRRASGAAARELAGCETVALALPAETDEQVRAVAEGALLGAYVYDRYLTKKHEPTGDLVLLSEQAKAKGAKQAVEAATAVAEAVNFARDLINTPPNDLYPESFAEGLKTRGKASKVAVTVTDDKTLQSKGYGGIMGVGKGSVRGPRLVKIAYKPTRPVAHLAFVGKGITFDSGGLSIKSSTAMGTMKCDMSGAAAVSAAVFAIADLGLPVRVTAYACLAENMPSGHATRPGDVLTMYGGKTVEVLNTDAEGRLVLADGITTANSDKPDLIVDVATLTGACVVALGSRMSGVFSNDEALHEELPQIAERAGELMWPLPIPEEMNDKVRTTKIADLSQHNPEAWGGALYAAAFLREFVGEGITWAHLDIAGPAFNDDSPWGYTPKGGTGAAVRTLVQLATERSH